MVLFVCLFELMAGVRSLTDSPICFTLTKRRRWGPRGQAGSVIAALHASESQVINAFTLLPSIVFFLCLSF